MRVKLQLVICHDDGHEETVPDVITLNNLTKSSETPMLTALCLSPGAPPSASPTWFPET
jgi:hypothetical protein